MGGSMTRKEIIDEYFIELPSAIGLCKPCLDYCLIDGKPYGFKFGCDTIQHVLDAIDWGALEEKVQL